MSGNLFNFIHQKRVTPFNPVIAEGYAVSQLKECEGHLTRLIRSAMTGCPEEFRFEGITPCSPQEMLAINLRKRGSRSYYEVSKNTLDAVKLNWSYKGVPLQPAAVFVPYSKEAGLLYIRGALFGASPVLVDKSISVGLSYIFIPLNGAKLTFSRMVHNVVIDDVTVCKYVIWSKVYNRSASSLKKQERRTINAETTMPHYLFCRFGLRETFARFAGVEIVCGNSTTVNKDIYPASDWMIFRSFAEETQVAPRGLGKVSYTASNFRIAIKRESYNGMAEGLLVGLFYIIDHFPDRITARMIANIDDAIKLEDECNLWQLLLAHIIFATGVSEGKLLQDIAPHMQSIATYVDDETKVALADDNIHVDDFYELIAHIIDTFSIRIMESPDDIASMYGKRLELLRYILSPITHNIYRMMYAIKGGKQIMDVDNLNKCINNFISPLLIQSINHKHGEVRSVSSPSDNMLFTITSTLVLQTNSSGMTPAKTKDNANDPSGLLDVSIAEVGNYCAVQKSEPTGRGRLNPTIQIGPNGEILRDERKRNFLDAIQRRFKGLPDFVNKE